MHPCMVCIYSVSMVLSLHNHISTDLKSHTCCTAIYLEAGIIAFIPPPPHPPGAAGYMRAFCLFVCACVSLCVCLYVNTYLKSPVFQA